MHNNRHIQCFGSMNMGNKTIVLPLQIPFAAIKIQTRLTNANYLWVLLRQIEQLLRWNSSTRHLIGMHTNRCPYVFLAFNQRHHSWPSLEIDADAQQPLYTMLLGIFQIRAKRRFAGYSLQTIQMAMWINQYCILLHILHADSNFTPSKVWHHCWLSCSQTPSTVMPDPERNKG